MSYIVRSGTNPAMILITSGEFKPSSMVGPGGYCAKVYKTKRGAQRAAERRNGVVGRSDTAMRVAWAWAGDDDALAAESSDYEDDPAVRALLLPGEERDAFVAAVKERLKEGRDGHARVAESE